MQQRRIVDLRIMGQRHEGRVVIDIERRQRYVRPFRDQRHVRKALRAGKSRPRIDHGHIVIERACQRRQRLADMNRAHDHQLRGRSIDVEEQFFAGDLDHPAFAHAQLPRQFGAQRIGGEIGSLDQPLLAAGDVRNDDSRPARRPLDIELRELFKLHDYPTFPTNTRMVPPQDRPTFQAVSSATPNSSIFGAPLAMTSSASVTTAPSTHPPETDPRKVPSSLMTRLEPAGRGAEPQVSTTVASATPRPAFCHSSAALRMSSSRLSMGASFKLQIESGCGDAPSGSMKAPISAPRSNSNYAPGGIRQRAAASF